VLAPQPYETLLEFLDGRVTSKGQTDYTFSEFCGAFPNLDASELLVTLHRLCDEWILNEISPKCYSVNVKLLKVARSRNPSRSGKGAASHRSAKTKKKSDEMKKNEVASSQKPTFYEQRERIPARFLEQIKSESQRFVPVIKKIIIDCATEYAHGSSPTPDYVFHTHMINKRIRQELGDVFDGEHLRLYSNYALESLTETWFLKKRDRVHWSVSLSDLGIEPVPMMINN